MSKPNSHQSSQIIKSTIHNKRDISSIILSKSLSKKKIDQIDQVVKKVIAEYGETLRLLANS